MKKQLDNFLKGAFLLAISGIVIKILGALYKIPIGTLLNETGSGYQGFSYAYYNFAGAVLISGFPVAIARIISENDAMNNLERSEQVFYATRNAMIVVGAVLALSLFFASPVITGFLGNTGATYTMQALSFGVFFISISFAYKGYFQGKKYLKYYAFSDILDQTIKVVIGLAMLLILLPYGVEYGSCGVSIATSLGATSSAILLIFFHKKYRKENINFSVKKLSFEEKKKIYKDVLLISLPIAGGVVLFNLVGILEGFIALEQLKALNLSTGIAETEALAIANKQYGYLTFYALSLISFPQILFNPLTISILPVLSSMHATCNIEKFKETMQIGFKIALFISFPCFVGMFLFSKEIFMLLWPSIPDLAKNASYVLEIMSAVLLLISIQSMSTTILNVIGKQTLPSIHIAIASVARIFCWLFLTKEEGIGFLSIPFGLFINYLIVSFLNILAINKYSPVKLEFLNIFKKPFIASFCMGLTVYLFRIFLVYLHVNLKIITLICILTGVFSYIGFLIVFKCIGKEEIEYLPAKNVLTKIFIRQDL